MKTPRLNHVFAAMGVLGLLLLNSCRLPGIRDMPLYDGVKTEIKAVTVQDHTAQGVRLEVVVVLENTNDEAFPVATQTIRFNLGDEVYTWEQPGTVVVPAEGHVEVHFTIAVANTQFSPETMWSCRCGFTYAPEGALRQALRDVGLPRPTSSVNQKGTWENISQDMP